jgi:putrescine aminotransferase
VSSFGGAELGCPVARKVLEITTRPETRANVHAVSDHLVAGLEQIQSRFPEWLVEVRRRGVVMGIRFAEPHGAIRMSKALFDAGLWAMFAGFDTSVLQFKAGLLVDAAYCDEALARFEDGVRRCLSPA